MKFTSLAIPDILLCEPKILRDERGTFYESFNQKVFDDTIGKPVRFVQNNHSLSVKGVLRGMHYQIKQAQGKLVCVTHGEVFDVSVDMRKSSPTFGKWVGEHLTASNHAQLWIPEGFAHGFVVLSETADFFYKTTDYWAPEYERRLAWDDADVAIDWPLLEFPTLSAKDTNAVSLVYAESFA